MAKASGLSQSAVVRIWHAFGLQPHRAETFKLSTDPLFIEKVRDIVGLYLNPPDRALVLCVDEKSQIQALDRTQPILPMMPGTLGRSRKAVRFPPRSSRTTATGPCAFGKWHSTPAMESAAAGPFANWPTNMGFEYFYGFLGGEAARSTNRTIVETLPRTAPRSREAR